MNRKHIRNIAVLLLSVLLLSSCHIVSTKNVKLFDREDFTKVTEIKNTEGNPYSKDGHIRIAVLTDVHVGRENNDPGVIRNHQNFYDFYKNINSASNGGEDIPVFLLGDICDTGKKGYYDLVNTFIKEIRSQRLDEEGKSIDKYPMPIIYIPGNHEFMDSDYETWKMYFGDRQDEGLYTLGSYSLGDILIESTNNAYRIYTKEQLDAIEYNLKQYDKDYTYKFFLGHIPLASEKIDQSLFWYVMADADERNEMLYLMNQYGPSFNLVGHLHEGAQFNEYAPDVKEFIFSSFHKREINRDKGGYWHIVDIAQTDDADGSVAGDVTIYAFDIDNKDADINDLAGTADHITKFNMYTATDKPYVK